MAQEEVYPDPMSLPIGNGPAAAGSNAAPHVAYDDLRSWIEETRRLGEIKELKGLSWQEDIGMVSEMALRDDDALRLKHPTECMASSCRNGSPSYVCFGSETDVRYLRVMSALPLKLTSIECLGCPLSAKSGYIQCSKKFRYSDACSKPGHNKNDSHLHYSLHGDNVEIPLHPSSDLRHVWAGLL